jgi:hypothetical protein
MNALSLHDYFFPELVGDNGKNDEGYFCLKAVAMASTLRWMIAALHRGKNW